MPRDTSKSTLLTIEHRPHTTVGNDTKNTSCSCLPAYLPASLSPSMPYHPSNERSAVGPAEQPSWHTHTNLAESARRQRGLSSFSSCPSSSAAEARTSSSSSHLSCRPPAPQAALRVLRAARSPPAPSLVRVGVGAGVGVVALRPVSPCVLQHKGLRGRTIRPANVRTR